MYTSSPRVRPSESNLVTARSRFSKFSLFAATTAYSELAKSSPAAAAFTFESPFRSYNRASPSVHAPQVLIADPVTAAFANAIHVTATFATVALVNTVLATVIAATVHTSSL